MSRINLGKTEFDQLQRMRYKYMEDASNKKKFWDEAIVEIKSLGSCNARLKTELLKVAEDKRDYENRRLSKLLALIKNERFD